MVFAAGWWLILTGCSDLTTVDAPGVLVPEQLANAEGATAQHAGALTLFAEAYGGPNGGRSVVLGAGLVADEFTNISAAGSLESTLDTRDMPESSGSGRFSHSRLSQARTNALAGIHLLEQYATEPRSRVGQLYALVGYTELFFAEHFCAGLTLTTVTAGRPVGASSYGTPLSRDQMLEQAAADFASAEANAGDDAQIANLAQVGRGRTLLNLGRFAEAASAVAPVPTSFVYSTEHSAAVTPNTLAQVNFVSVSDREGGNGLDFRTADDPRLTVALGSGDRSNVYVWTKMAALATPLPLATGMEARLIEAEAALQAGNVVAWLAIHNALRETVPALGPVADPGSSEARVDLHFKERAFWLFGQGQRLSDLRRLVRQYGRAVDAVFPVGAYLGPVGGTYGPDVAMTPPPSERRNPNYIGCQSRDP